MKYNIQLEQFEGPLDLLLQLIEQEKMDITQVCLAAVTDQYLEYLNSSQRISPEELADFLVVAAKLLLIKSRVLLPSLEIDEEEGIDLEKQLKIYKEFYEASTVLQKMIGKKKFLYTRDRMVTQVDKVFNPPASLNQEKMHEIMEAIISGLEPWVGLPSEVITRTISIKERIRNIQQMIRDQATINFGQLLKQSKNKTEVIVTFLALLELVKQRAVAVAQEGVFDDIVVKPVSSPDDQPNQDI